MVDTQYEPGSAFGWLDYDERDAQRMREVLSAFDEKQTVDSLGFGVVRDSFADQLHPGTTTIQTRARYFFLVPWAFLQLEAQRVPPADLWRRLRDIEVRTIESLVGVGSNQGVIGFRTRSKTQRMPSVVYWNGLGAYGIRTQHLSMEEYRQSASSLARRQKQVERDDDHGVLGSVPRYWDTSLPEALPGFPDEATTLDLTADEALYLATRIHLSCAGTLLATVAAQPERVRDAELPWDLPDHVLTGDQRTLLHHGRCFSEAVYGAQLLYNLLLCDRAEKEIGAVRADLTDTIRVALTEWATMIDDRRDVIEKWFADLDDFWPIVENRSAVGLPTKRFVVDWIRHALNDPHAAADRAEARNLVIQREHALKGKHARLVERRALETWKGEPFGMGQLSYRWNIARRHMIDIADGLTS